METRRIENIEQIEDIGLELDESKVLPSTEEMLLSLDADPSRCLSWL